MAKNRLTRVVKAVGILDRLKQRGRRGRHTSKVKGSRVAGAESD